MKIYIKDIISVCNAKLVCGDVNLECVNFSKDSRTINKGDVYIAIKGEKFDGNDYFEEAFLKGASACILNRIDLDNIDINKYKNKNNIEVVLFTCSVGKTSTKDMIASVLSLKYKVLKTVGNNNNHIGLPLTILRLKDEEVLVVEMGMNHFNEISLLTNIAKPTIGVITNIGTSHIGNLGSRENILKAKLEIVEGLIKDKVLIINNDNDLLHNISIDGVNIIKVGIDNNSDYMARDINIDKESMNFNIVDNEELINIELKINAPAFVYNSLIAYAVAKKLNVSSDLIKKGLENVELSQNRLSKVTTNKGYTIIDDTYNASFDSMKLALGVLNKSSGSRKIAVLGDMLELGDYTKELHEKIADEIINNNIDIVITVGKFSKYISDKLKKDGFSEENIYHYFKVEEVCNLLDNLLKKGDVILFKSSHAIGLTRLVNYLVEKE